MKPLSDKPNARADRGRRKAKRKGLRLILDGDIWRLFAADRPIMAGTPNEVEHYLLHGVRLLRD